MYYKGVFGNNLTVALETDAVTHRRFIRCMTDMQIIDLNKSEAENLHTFLGYVLASMNKEEER
jgi:hypothetical protein